MKYQIVKTVYAKNIIEAIENELKAKIESVVLVEEDEKEVKLGFK